MTVPVGKLLEEVSEHGGHIMLNENWNGVVLRTGSQPVPSKLRLAISRRREEVAAYLVGQKLADWLRRWQPPEGSWVN